MRPLSKLFLSCLCLAAAACGTGTPHNLVHTQTARAARQLGQLLEAADSAGQPRIPATFRNGEVVYVPTDDWVSGFFAGSLWYLYELTDDARWADAARRHTEALDSIQYLEWHHDVGFMIYDSYGNGFRLTGDPAYRQVVVRAARSLATRYREAAGVIQSWNVDRGWQAERGWRCPVIIDNMMNLELLFKASEFSGDDTYYKIAVSHADRTLAEHFRADNSCYHVVDYDPADGSVRGRCTAQGYADESAWARGQAWALYGYTVCYRFTGDPRYLEQAERVRDFIFSAPTLPEDGVPMWDFAADLPAEWHYRDVSSAAIIASALYELADYTHDAADRERADRLVEVLSKAPYRTEADEAGGFLLLHSVGSLPHGSNIDVPLNYADYYYLEALVRKRHAEAGEPVI